MDAPCHANKLAESTELVFPGFVSQLAAADINHVLKVCLISEMKDRLAVAERDEGLPKACHELVRKDDEDRAAWVKTLRGVDDPWTGTLYDIVVPVGSTGVEKSADLIVEQLSNAAVQVTDASRAKVQDFLLAARVETVLAREGHSVLVSADSGVVSLTINKHVLMLEKLENELAGIVSGIEGVKDVKPAWDRASTRPTSTAKRISTSPPRCCWSMTNVSLSRPCPSVL